MTQAIRPSSITCARCGAEKDVGRSGPIPAYCSANCRAAVKYERSREDGRYELALAAARQATRHRQQANASPCPYCGRLMTHPRRVQCGEAPCKARYYADRMAEWQRKYKEQAGEWYHRNYAQQQRAYHQRRRQELGHWRKLYPVAAAMADARRRSLVSQARTAEAFAPIDVHTRDDWTCRLCWMPIDPALAWPDSMNASVDHIVPLSRGGAHAMDNVQSAHLGCNSSKGDRLMVDLVIRIGTQAVQG